MDLASWIVPAALWLHVSSATCWSLVECDASNSTELEQARLKHNASFEKEKESTCLTNEH